VTVKEPSGWKDGCMTPNLVTLGIDVSDRFSSYCVIDPAGDVVEEGRLRTTESALLSRFKDFTGRVVVEAGTHSPWISRVFAALGTEVVVANPRRVN
jgi:transposase